MATAKKQARQAKRATKKTARTIRRDGRKPNRAKRTDKSLIKYARPITAPSADEIESQMVADAPISTKDELSTKKSVLETIQGGLNAVKEGVSVANDIKGVFGKNNSADDEGSAPSAAIIGSGAAEAKPDNMEWLKKNWYIPAIAIVVIGGIIYFVKRGK